MRYRLLASLCVAVLLIGAGAAQAHDRTFESTVDLQIAQRISEGSNVLRIIGQVTSPKAQCVPDRAVRIVAVLVDGSRRMIDVARSSDNGFFVGQGDFSGAVAAVGRMPRARIGGGPRHQHICAPGSDRLE